MSLRDVDRKMFSYLRGKAAEQINFISQGNSIFDIMGHEKDGSQIFFPKIDESMHDGFFHMNIQSFKGFIHKQDF